MRKQPENEMSKEREKQLSDFGNRLCEARKRKKFKQSQLGDLIGVSDQTISDYECGNREPSFLTLKKICDVLECDFRYLTGEIDSFTPNIQSASEETGLNEKTIDELKNFPYRYDDELPPESIEETRKNFLAMLDYIITSDPYGLNELLYYLMRYSFFTQLSSKEKGAEFYNLLAIKYWNETLDALKRYAKRPHTYDLDRFLNNSALDSITMNKEKDELLSSFKENKKYTGKEIIKIMNELRMPYA